MRLRWHLALGGGLLALALVLLAGIYDEVERDPQRPARRPSDPLFALVAVAIGAGAGLAAGVALERPLQRISRGVRDAEAGSFERLGIAKGAPYEAVDLVRALNDLQERQADLAADLRAETARLEVILDSITEGILVTGPDGRILMANRALRSLFGITRPISGRRPVEVVRDAVVGEAIDRVLAGGGALSREVTLGAGGQRHLDVQVAPIAGPEAEGDPEIVGTVTVFYEITRLRRLERMRADFVANVSHELRTPLTAIKGCAETLADGAIGDPEASVRFVAAITGHADRLTVLLSDLLDLSRLESDQVHVDAMATPVQRLVDTARDALAKVAADKDIGIEAEIPEGLTARCDRRLVEQALLNLVDNAVKYTPDGGTVRISARRLPRDAAILDLARRRWSAGGVERVGDDEDDTEAILVEVADTGIGIPSKDVERVFERFYRVDKGRSRAMGGTGLGLSIVRHVVELHGERIFVDSELGHGSVFGFTLTCA